LQQALDHGTEAILLDHMSVPDVRKAGRKFVRGNRGGFRWSARAESRCRTCGPYAEAGVDFISVAALTLSAARWI